MEKIIKTKHSLWIILFLYFATSTLCAVCDFGLQRCKSCDRYCPPIGGCVCSDVDPACVLSGCSGCFPSSPVSLCSAIPGLRTELNNLNAQITSAQQQLTQKTNQYNGLLSQITALEAQLNITQYGSFTTDFRDKLNTITEKLAGLENTLKAKVELPLKIVQLFPKLFLGQRPDKILNFVQKRMALVVDWFSKSFVQASKGLGRGTCATCLYTSLQDGSISMGIEVSDGPSIGFSVEFDTINTARCFVNNLAALSVVMRDLTPTELIGDSVETTARLLMNAADALTTYSNSIQKSKICNRTEDILPAIRDPNTGIPAVDALLTGLTEFINTLGSGGVFGDLMNGVVNAICTSNTPTDFQELTKDIRNFVRATSFPSLEEQVFKTIFFGVNKLTTGFNQFLNMQLNIPVNCDPNDKACQLVTKYGNSYIQCIQESFIQGKIGLGFSVSIGQVWLPPMAPGWGVGASFNAESLACVLGLKTGAGALKDTIKMILGDFLNWKGAENVPPTNCIQPQTECANVGSWDSRACACRCATGFLPTSLGCQSCPGPESNVCNGRGACYFNNTAPACCCTGGNTDPACETF